MKLKNLKQNICDEYKKIKDSIEEYGKDKGINFILILKWVFIFIVIRYIYRVLAVCAFGMFMWYTSWREDLGENKDLALKMLREGKSIEEVLKKRN